MSDTVTDPVHLTINTIRAVVDGDTCVACRSRDGQTVEVGDGGLLLPLSHDCENVPGGGICRCSLEENASVVSRTVTFAPEEMCSDCQEERRIAFARGARFNVCPACSDKARAKIARLDEAARP